MYKVPINVLILNTNSYKNLFNEEIRRFYSRGGIIWNYYRGKRS